MEQTSFLGTCDPSVADFQSHNQCRIWQMNSMFEAMAVVKFCVIHKAMNRFKSKDLLNNCF